MTAQKENRSENAKRGLFVGRFQPNACSRWESALRSLRSAELRGDRG